MIKHAAKIKMGKDRIEIGVLLYIYIYIFRHPNQCTPPGVHVPQLWRPLAQQVRAPGPKSENPGLNS